MPYIEPGMRIKGILDVMRSGRKVRFILPSTGLNSLRQLWSLCFGLSGSMRRVGFTHKDSSLENLRLLLRCFLYLLRGGFSKPCSFVNGIFLIYSLTSVSYATNGANTKIPIRTHAQTIPKVLKTT